MIRNWSTTDQKNGMKTFLPIVERVDDDQEEDDDGGTAVDPGDATAVLGDREMEEYVRHETAVSGILGVA
jgi:hypothetical protein